jgi:hypothetical protein
MQTSIIKPIIIAFKIVPIPGFCLSGNQRNKTPILINTVIIPIERSTFNAIPCARIDQGEAPAKETINNPSPRPNKTNPRHKKKKVEIFGLRFNGFSELQYTLGISLIFKNIFSINYFF